LPIIQATMDLIQWFLPLLNRLPRDHRFALGDRLVQGLYDLLEGLVAARHGTVKLERLEPLNARLVGRCETRTQLCPAAFSSASARSNVSMAFRRSGCGECPRTVAG
jgi:hypothetical protein